MTSWMVVRVRGSIHAKHEIVETLQYLHLTRPNHATVVPDEPGFKGMLHKVQGYVTWGETDAPTVELLLGTRGETPDGAKLAGAGSAPDLSALSKSVLEAGLPRTAGVRPLFRLKPPKGGWRSTKKPFALGGALGYRGPKINELIRRMV